MSLLAKLRSAAGPSGNVPDQATCPHRQLTPRWRGPEVMDDDSQAMGFVCHRCHREFMPSAVVNRRPRAR